MAELVADRSGVDLTEESDGFGGGPRSRSDMAGEANDRRRDSFELGFGDTWSFEMEDPVFGRTIRHQYRVERLFDEIAERYRVPLVTGALSPKPS